MLLYENTTAPVQAYNRTMQTKNRDFHISPRQVMPSDSNNVRIVQKKETSITYRAVIQKAKLTPDNLEKLIDQVLETAGKKPNIKQCIINLYQLLTNTNLTSLSDLISVASKNNLIDEQDILIIESTLQERIKGPSSKSSEVKYQTNADLIEKVKSLEQHLYGEYDKKNNRIIGGHLLQDMQNKWGEKLQYKKTWVNPKNNVWKGTWQLEFSKTEKTNEKESTFFPEDWDFSRLLYELQNSTYLPNQSTAILPSNIKVSIGDTCYPKE